MSDHVVLHVRKSDFRCVDMVEVFSETLTRYSMDSSELKSVLVNKIAGISWNWGAVDLGNTHLLEVP